MFIFLACLLSSSKDDPQKIKLEKEKEEFPEMFQILLHCVLIALYYTSLNKLFYSVSIIMLSMGVG